MRNYSVSQKYFFQRENVGKFEVAECCCTITANVLHLRSTGNSLLILPGGNAF